jgi:glycosyltransferase 2 family protein
VLPRRVPVVGARTLVPAAALAVAAWAALGAHLWLLAGASGTDQPFSYGTAVGCFALAWAAGVVAVVAPAGIGVRELALVALLTPVLSGGHGAALAVVVLSRCLTAVSDSVLSLSALASRRRRSDRRTP